MHTCVQELPAVHAGSHVCQACLHDSVSDGEWQKGCCSCLKQFEHPLVSRPPFCFLTYSGIHAVGTSMEASERSARTSHRHRCSTSTCWQRHCSSPKQNAQAQVCCWHCPGRWVGGQMRRTGRWFTPHVGASWASDLMGARSVNEALNASAGRLKCLNNISLQLGSQLGSTLTSAGQRSGHWCVHGVHGICSKKSCTVLACCFPCHQTYSQSQSRCSRGRRGRACGSARSRPQARPITTRRYPSPQWAAAGAKQ